MYNHRLACHEMIVFQSAITICTMTNRCYCQMCKSHQTLSKKGVYVVANILINNESPSRKSSYSFEYVEKKIHLQHLRSAGKDVQGHDPSRADTWMKNKWTIVFAWQVFICEFTCFLFRMNYIKHRYAFSFKRGFSSNRSVYQRIFSCDGTKLYEYEEIMWIITQDLFGRYFLYAAADASCANMFFCGIFPIYTYLFT